MATTHPAPAYALTLDGVNLAPTIAPRLISLVLTDCSGTEADTLDLTLSDHDGSLAIPRTGVRISLAIGWQGQPLVDKGSFKVDEVEHSGSPDRLVIRARSADLAAGFRVQRDQSWHAVTLGEIINTLAQRNGLNPRIAAALASIEIPHIDQTAESDAAFITRLGLAHDAIATVKHGRLIFLPKNFTQTSAGESATPDPTASDLPPVQIVRSDGDSHTYSVSDRNAYSGVRAYWHDPSRAKRRGVLVGISGNAKHLRETFASEADALRAAQAEWQRIERGAATFELALALGRPEAIAQSPVTVTGFKDEIDGTDWIASRVVHTLSADSGFTTHIQAEILGTRRSSDGEASAPTDAAEAEDTAEDP